MYAFRGGAGATGSGQTYAAALNYNTGPLTMAAGYFHADNGNATLTTRGAGTTTDNIFFSPINSAYASASKYNIARAGASYILGPVTIGGYYSYSEYLADAGAAFRDAEPYNNGSGFAPWRVTTATQFEIGYHYPKSHGDSPATSNQATVAADYSLSK